MRTLILSMMLLVALPAVSACATEETVAADRQGLGDIHAFKLSFPTTRLDNFAPEVMDGAIINVAEGRGHSSYFVQAGTRGNVCTSEPGGCEDWNVVAIKTDGGFSDVITEDNDNAVLFVRAVLDGKHQTLLLTAKRGTPAGPPAAAYHIQPAAVTLTVYALQVEPEIDAENFYFVPVKSWTAAGSYCRTEAAMWRLTDSDRRDIC